MTATLTSAEQRPPKVRRKQAATKSIFDPAIVAAASIDSFKKLNPRTMMRNPVMFIVWVGSLVTTVMFIRDFGESDTQQNVFAGLVAAWLWFTVLFANFAEAMAGGARQGPGRHAAQDPGGDDSSGPAAPTARSSRSPRRSSSSATCAS